jgi:hypothetical protein
VGASENISLMFLCVTHGYSLGTLSQQKNFAIKTQLLKHINLYESSASDGSGDQRYHIKYLKHKTYNFKFNETIINKMLHFIITYFPKMKAGLSNHQSVCLSVCHPLITSEPFGRFS